MREFVLVLVFGGGSVLILLLTLFMNFEQHVAQATNLLFFVPAAVVSIVLNLRRGNINLKNAMPLMFFGVIGSIIGSMISGRMQVSSLRKFFGIFLLFICAYEMRSYYILYIKNKNKA